MLQALLLLLFTASVAFGAQEWALSSVHHELDLELFPAENRLSATDSITLKIQDDSLLSFTLAENATIHSVSIDDREAPFDFVRGLITLPLGEHAKQSSISVAITYEAIFDDPTPHRPAGTEDPSYGVAGTISEEGVFLLPAAGWYPRLVGNRATFNVRVEAPLGMIAVTAGQSLGHRTLDRKTISRWEIRQPLENIALSADRYIVAERWSGRIRTATYFLAPNAHLSGTYLEAVADYLGLYENLFGPYPFAKFAVVENFFPTGYGFPSYTLLGSSVLRLPFIVRTSLGHEVAHCWWGNGVHVDASQGNWSEALTTYVADYLYKERASTDDALLYRQQALRDYATLVPPAEDFPLKAFSRRHSPASRAIGYAKGAMVFHMLRGLIGDEAFWKGLRKVYREKLFQTATWSDLQAAFEQTGNRILQGFFDQWLIRAGAPMISMDNVTVEQCADSWKISGLLRQERPFYLLRLGMFLETQAGTIQRNFDLSGKERRFEISSDSPPKRLSVDPEFNVFRRLYPVEIPPTINSVKGSDALTVLMADGSSPGMLAVTKTLLHSLGLKDYRLLAKEKVSDGELAANDVLIVGYPERQDLLSTLPTTLTLEENRFRIDSETYDRPEDTFFGVFAHPLNGDRVLAILLPTSPENAQTVARKITHYGKYSYLAFRQGRNLQKGIWPVTESPLIQTWTEER